MLGLPVQVIFWTKSVTLDQCGACFDGKICP